MRIGEFARRAGVNPQTIRFYERKLILRPAPRTASGYRSYSEPQLETIAFIKQCQQLGFSLLETRQLLELHHGMASLPLRAAKSSRKAAEFQQIALDRLASIDEKLAALQQMRAQLSALLQGFECWRNHRNRK
jgi:DNA-binding transcriptional MerR regulator